MTKKIIWRLANRPTPMEVLDLLKGGILDKEEARQILFTLESEEDRQKESLQEEIKFLRDLVEKLAKNNTIKIVDTIRYIQQPYMQNPWFQPYQVWCGSGASAGSTQFAGSSTGPYLLTGSGGGGTGTITLGGTGVSAGTPQNFSSINTF